MSRTTPSFTQKSYSLVRVCRVWRVGRFTVYEQRLLKTKPTGAAVRPGPVGPCRDQDLVQHLQAILAASPSHGVGYPKVWVPLRDAGLRTLKRRVLRLMREYQLLPPHRRGGSLGPLAPWRQFHPGRGNETWGTDTTAALITEEGQAAVFVP
uniref:HTH-like domain-containing protein n=1 Tax=Desulfobacca acetoxidans TaxID=60893 RepID=A0A7V4G949_9BACT